MVVNKDVFARWATHAAFALCAWCATFPFASAALAAPGTVEVTVKAPSATGTNIGVGFRWLLEEDSTYAVTPGDATATDSLALNMHKSHMTVVAKGHSATNPASVPVPDTGKRYFLSILPDQSAPNSTTPLDCQQAGNCYTMSGRQITPDLFANGSATLTVAVTGQPVPTAQIFARAYEDSAPINGVWDDGEAPLGGWATFIYDMGGQLSTDT
ncbi:MAG: hypothetical protein ACRET4_00525, partial [Steroidobacteraceae bacterium]